MDLRTRFLFFALLTVAVIRPLSDCNADEKWGDLVGRFILEDGTTSAQPAKIVEKYLGRGPKVEVSDETLLIAGNGGVRNIVIYLTDDDVTIHPGYAQDEKVDAEFNIQMARFDPHVLSLRWSQNLAIRNATEISQNARIAIKGEAEINPLILHGGVIHYSLSDIKTAPLRVTNSLAPWMSAYIFALPHPYVAISKADGAFEIKNLPVGEHEFQIWHEKMEKFEFSRALSGRLKVVIGPGKNSLDTISVRRKGS